MTNKMRIGEYLLLRESIDAIVLSQTVRQQQETGQRLVSTLIMRALIESDEGALALSEQTGFPAALQRHLERRDTTVVDAVPAPLARAWVVVPIGRSHNGDLVVCARDPTPILAASLEHASKSKVKLCVAPAIHVEKLVRSVYDAPGRGDAPLPNTPPSLTDIGEAEVGEARPTGRGRSMSRMMEIDESGPIRAPTHELSPLEITLQEADQAFSMVAVERMVMSFAAQRWRAALLVKIGNGFAQGQRGHGAHLGPVEAINLPLGVPTLISLAVDTRKSASAAPNSPAQRHLLSLLGAPQRAIAAPIECRGAVRSVLVVGDPLDGSHQQSVFDLDRLADALSAAYDRFTRAGTRGDF